MKTLKQLFKENIAKNAEYELELQLLTVKEWLKQKRQELEKEYNIKTPEIYALWKAKDTQLKQLLEELKQCS